jgi:hypothetical protein
MGMSHAISKAGGFLSSYIKSGTTGRNIQIIYVAQSDKAELCGPGEEPIRPQ